MRKIADLLNNDRGQGLVEYALILMLIAVVVIISVTSIGTKTCAMYSQIDSKLGQKTE